MLDVGRVPRAQVRGEADLHGAGGIGNGRQAEKGDRRTASLP
jgi:hypothetical protein